MKTLLVLFMLLAVQSCKKEGLVVKSSGEDQGKNHQEALKCLKPYEGQRLGLFSQNQQDLVTDINWDDSKQIQHEKFELSETLFAIRMTEVGSEFTGRFMVYRDLGGQPKLLGSVADFKNLKYDCPSLRILSETKWLESKECVMVGTGVDTYWCRYWELEDDKVCERLALPISGKQQMSTGQPWREFSLEPIMSQCTDAKLVFLFHANCELVYVPEGKTETSSIQLPKIRKRIYFEKGANGWIVLNEVESDLTLRNFQILTNTQLEYGPEFWEVYEKEIEKISQSGERESVRDWLDDHHAESWAIPESISTALSRGYSKPNEADK